eukprot:7035547-Prymnesium_polylepis.1
MEPYERQCSVDHFQIGYNVNLLHPRMLGAIVGTLVHSEHVQAAFDVHLLSKQLAKEFTCNDWGN